MTLIADEGVDREIVERLRADGHDVAYVAEMSPGIPDDEVLRAANESSAVLLTQDKDFGDLVFRQGLVATGVVLLRLAGLPADAKCHVVANALKTHQQKLRNAFTVVSGNNVRIRRL